ncbi:helix-turn-helix domain-containing protein [Flavobacterium sp.]|uniref:helix-turn-helix domain-containing protein n=1 Tax=Flavobacterium sp. TaxID=239 RepID=UPI0028BE179D|nr:helix-turn-helix domain-containing protein [Flavobacterium sp.]
MQENNSQFAKNTIKGLKKSLNVKTDLELAKILDVKPNTISTWKKRNTLDYQKIIQKCLEHSIDLHELFRKENEQITDEQEISIISKELIYQYTRGQLSSLSRLPSAKLPFNFDKDTLIFQIENQKKENQSPTSTFAICKKIELPETRENELYIVISQKKGFFIAFIQKDSDSESIILKQEDQPAFNDSISIALDDIDEIWEIKGNLSIW